MSERIFAVLVAKPSISVLGYMDGYERNFRYFGCETQKTVLGYIEGFEKIFEGNFTLNPELFQKSVLGIVEGYFKEVQL